MGDLIAIMKDGRLVQCDRPERLLSQPLDAFVPTSWVPTAS